MLQFVEFLAGVPKNPDSIPAQEEFFLLKFLLKKGNETNGKEQQLK